MPNSSLVAVKRWWVPDWLYWLPRPLAVRRPFRGFLNVQYTETRRRP